MPATPLEKAADSDVAEVALEVLNRSGKPLAATQILGLLPKPFQVPEPKLEEILEHLISAGKLFRWPPYQKRGSRYWLYEPERLAHDRILEILAGEPQSRSALAKNLAKRLHGYPQESCRRLLPNLLKTLEQERRVYKHPRVGSIGEKFSVRPAEPDPYLRSLKKEFEAACQKLERAGVSRAAMLEGARRVLQIPLEPHARDEPPEELSRRVLQCMEKVDPSARDGAIVALRDIRRALDPPPPNKEAFDRAVLQLFQEEAVFLYRHDFPYSLSEEERNQLVTDGQGNFYVGIAFRT